MTKLNTSRSVAACYGKVFPSYAMKAYKECSSGGTPLVLNLDTRGRSMFIFNPLPLYPGCHWIRKAGAPESVWTFSRRKISCLPTHTTDNL